jgi:hypothetical protein
MPMNASSSLEPQPVMLAYGGRYDTASGVMYCAHNAGFFANCSVALTNMADVTHRGLPWPKRIDFSGAFSSYRNDVQQSQAVDLYPLYFRNRIEAKLPSTQPIPKVNHHGLYRFLDFERLNEVMARYFTPSAQALEMEADLIRRYSIDLNHTLAVVYRGTDKGTEVKLGRPEDYLKAARDFLMHEPEFKVWIQTDEVKVRDLFVRTLGPRCFFLREMPVSANGVVVHCLDDDALNMDRSDFGVLLVAVTHLLSRTAAVVNHTGNMALWICLWRGHAQGLIQFDDEGGLVDFSDPRFYLRRFRGVLRKAALRLGWTRASNG